MCILTITSCNKLIIDPVKPYTKNYIEHNNRLEGNMKVYLKNINRNKNGNSPASLVFPVFKFFTETGEEIENLLYVTISEDLSSLGIKENFVQLNMAFPERDIVITQK